MEYASSPARHELDLSAVGRALWRGKLIIGALTLAGALLAIVYLNRATYLYTAQLEVVPAAVSRDAAQSSAVSGLAAIAGLGGSGPSDFPFLLYKQGLHSRETADSLARDPLLMQRLFAGEWDGQTRTWVEPRGTRKNVVSAVKDMLGLPVFDWTAPDGARVQSFLESAIEINESPNSPVVTIRFHDPDPKFAVDFLTLLNRRVDQSVRQRTLRKTGDYIAYLSGKLATVSLLEHRASLAAELAAQERQRMMASGSAAFAAEPIDRIVVSSFPTSPRATVVLGAAVLAGFLLGVSIVLFTSRRGLFPKSAACPPPAAPVVGA